MAMSRLLLFTKTPHPGRNPDCILEHPGQMLLQECQQRGQSQLARELFPERLRPDSNSIYMHSWDD